MSKAKIDTKMTEIKVFAKDFSDKLDQGNVDTLVEFETKIRELCEELENAPREISQDYEDELKGLINSLADWANKLKNIQTELKDNLSGINEKLKAKQAYEKVMQHSNDNEGQDN